MTWFSGGTMYCRTPEKFMNTDHLGGDILAGKRLTREELRAPLSSLLLLSPENIIVYKDWQELPEKAEKGKFYCRYWHPQGGEFQTVIDLPTSLLHGLPRNTTASTFATLLDCPLLVDDGSINPYTFLLYDEKGNIRSVAIDVDAFGRNEFVVDRGWRQ
jgi:hypothetical protein